MSAWRLDGKRALVTGATRGIGAATVAELADLGAEVGLVARDPAGVAEAVAAHRAQGRDVWGLAADVATAEGRAAVIAATRDRGEALHVLVANVGTNLRKPTLEVTEPEWDQLVRTNVTSSWDLCRGAHPMLIAAGGASVVLTSSVASTRAIRTSTAIYAMSKGAIEGLARFLACEWGPAGIRVNVVAPWYVRTPLAAPVLADPARAAAILERTPMGRVGEPEEVARAIAFLAMPASGWITGVSLPVDGGFSALGL